MAGGGGGVGVGVTAGEEGVGRRGGGVIGVGGRMIHSATETVCKVGAMQTGSEGDGSDASINA